MERRLKKEGFPGLELAIMNGTGKIKGMLLLFYWWEPCMSKRMIFYLYLLFFSGPWFTPSFSDALSLPNPLDISEKMDRLPPEISLLNYTIIDVLKDRAGFIWFATERGLVRYDGYEALTYLHDPEDPATLSHSNIFDLEEDRNGFLWVATERGLNRLNPQTGEIRRYLHNNRNPESLAYDHVISLCEDRTGRLWVGTFGGGLDCLEDPSRDVFRHFRSDPEGTRTLRSDKVSCIVEDASGILWLGTLSNGSLHRFDPVRNEFEQIVLPGRPSIVPDITSISLDRSGAVWCGTWNEGLYRYDPRAGKAERFVHDPADPNSLGGDIISGIYEDNSGLLWIASRGFGLSLFDYDTKTFRHIQPVPGSESGLINDTLIMLTGDSSGAIWVGYDAGISRYDPENFRIARYRHIENNPESLSDNRVYALSTDRSGRLWIGTDGGGVDCFDPADRSFLHYRHDPRDPDGLSGNTVTALLVDHRGLLWIGNWNTKAGPLQTLDLQTGRFRRFIENVDDPNAMHGMTVRALAEDHNGFIWIGTEDWGINVYDPGNNTFRHYAPDPNNPRGLHDKYIRCIYVDRAGTVWVGTQKGGLYRWNPERDDFDAFRYDSGDRFSLASGGVSTIYEDRKGRLWIGTDSALCQMLDDDSFSRYTEKQGLGDSMIKKIVEDDQGHLWISMDNGLLSRFSPDRGEVWTFSKNDGLQGLTFTIGCGSRSENGEVYFGGLNGFNVIKPNEIGHNTRIPPVVVTRMEVMGKPVPVLGGKESPPVRLRYNQNFLNFTFSALNYIRPQKNQYAYRLLPIEPEWIACGNSRQARYTTLLPGRYEFQVKGSNNDGVWNEEGASVSVLIEPPFWDTRWFKILAAGLFVLFLVLLYRRRVRSLKMSRIFLEEEVKKQTLEIKQQSQALEMANQELERLSFLDGLTGVANRRRLEDHLDREWRRALRNVRPISFIMIDVDCFKKFNDTYGHHAGDECLKQVAAVLNLSVKRPGDLAARYGGEEFAVVLPEIDTDCATLFAESLRARIESLRIPHGASEAATVVTVSLGVSGFVPSKDFSASVLIEKADENLYLAKQQGRNRVVAL